MRKKEKQSQYQKLFEKDKSPVLLYIGFIPKMKTYTRNILHRRKIEIETVIVKKRILSSPFIPGYNLNFLLGIILIGPIITL